MRRAIWAGACILLLIITPALSVRAASQTYNDPHARWSIVLPDAYHHAYEQYNQGDAQHPGFNEIIGYTSPTRDVSVSYAECCRPDAAKQMERAQADFDAERTAYPGATIGPDGFQPTILSGRPALRFDTYYEYSGIPLHEQTIVAFSGFLSYVLRFRAPTDGFDALQSEFAAITDSFRFTVRSVVAGVYSDPQGRFIFSPPSGYDMVPNFDDEVSDQDESGVTLALDPMADGNRDSFMIVKTSAEDRTFDAVFDVYATNGLQSLARNGAELGIDGLRRTTIDSHAAGIEDYYEQSDAGIRFHVYQIFTVIGDLQYFIGMTFPDDGSNGTDDTVDMTLASFHFYLSR